MIRLTPVTNDNQAVCRRLSVSKKQLGFVADNAYSLAQAEKQPEMIPIAIYNEQTMIGFAMHAKEDKTKRIWIVRFMIDQQYQHKGLGKEALAELLKLLFRFYDTKEIYLSYEPENTRAASFYQAAGFLPTGQIEDGELVVRLNI